MIKTSVLAVVLVLGLASCSEPPPLRIGFLGGLSGLAADLGEPGRNGALLAVEQRNAAGGVNGRRVELIVRDDRQDDDTAIKMFQELVAVPVKAVVGPMTSSVTTAVLPVANENRLLTVSPTATSVDLTGKDDHLIRINGTTRDYARAYADFYFNNTGTRRVAITYDIGNRAFSESWLKEFEAAFAGLGGTITASIPFKSSGITGYAEITEMLIQSSPDALLFLSGTVDTVRFTQQARRIAPDMPLIAAEWAATERLFELGGRDMEGLQLAQTYNRENSSERYQTFREAYKARFRQEPGFATVNGYDATNIIMDVLAAGGTGEQFKKKFLELNPYQGLQRTIDFDRYGDNVSPAYFTVIKDGRFVLVEDQGVSDPDTSSTNNPD